MRTIIGDILNVERGIIVHQTNCVGVMGGGLAAAIRSKWPHVNDEYEFLCWRVPKTILLGRVQFVPVSSKLTVCNLFGQLEPGHGLQTDYQAVADGLSRLMGCLREGTSYNSRHLYFPYMMSCGLAGGDWKGVIRPMLRTICPQAKIVMLPSIKEKIERERENRRLGRYAVA